MQHLDKSGIAVIHNFTVADIQLRDFRHILFAELEVPDRKILLHTVFMNRLGN